MKLGIGGGLLLAVGTLHTLGAQEPPGTRYRAGFEALRVTDSARSRPIQLNVWYPTDAEETFHGYGISTGRVASGPPMAAGQFPVVLLSHGSLGSTTNYVWIAERLARAAFVVVGVDHFGESPVYGPQTIDPAAVADFGTRTRDFRFAVDYVLQRSKWATGVDGERVGALGHSAGGATVAMLAGAQYREEALAAFCLSKEGPTDRGCGYRPAGAPATPTGFVPPVAEPRVRAIVLLDPAVGPGFDRAGLAHVAVPALVVGSVANDFLPFALNAERYGRFLRNAELLRLDRGEGHFVYLDECTASIEAMGLRICSDRPGVTRRAIHERLGERIVDFFTRQLQRTAGTRGRGARKLPVKRTVR